MRVSLQTMLIQPAALTVRGVYKSLRSMAEQKGSGATARRKGTILSLLRSCRQGLSRVTPSAPCSAECVSESHPADQIQRCL